MIVPAVQIEPALGVHGSQARNLPREPVHELPALLVFAAHLGDALLRPSKCGSARALGERADRSGHRAVDAEEETRQIRRRHDVAEPPARHGVGLGERVEEDQAVAVLVKGEQRHVDAAGLEDLLVGLVDDEEQIPFGTEVRDRLQLVAPIDDARGVVRVVDHDEARARCHRGADRLDVDVVVGAVGNGDGHGTELSRDQRVEREGRIEHDRFIARIEERGEHAVDARARAAGGEDVIGRVARPRFALDRFAHRLQELRISLAGGVPREVLVERPLRGLPDVRRRGEERISRVELEHARRLLGGEVAGAFAARSLLDVPGDMTAHTTCAYPLSTMPA